LNDTEFLASFESATLPRHEWTHAAHVRMAFLYLSCLPYADAEQQMIAGIQRYNAAQRNHNGYHHTITVVFARLIAAKIKTKSVDWSQFGADNPELLSFACLEKYYSRALLRTEKARGEFVEPDGESLPI
jgi:hypothetical protein